MFVNESLGFEEAIYVQYEEGISDYWIKPLIACKEGKPIGRITNGDTVLFCCRRGEREVQLTESFVDRDFNIFPVEHFDDLQFLPLVEYHEKFAHINSIVEPIRPSVTLGKVLSEVGFKQLLITETEKESHVTFFFNGRRSKLFTGQVAKIIPSWKDFGSHPEMKSEEIGSLVVKSMDKYDFIIVNFPAGDVIGHLSDFELKISAAEEIDIALGKIYKEAIRLGKTLIITADHGLMEKGKKEDGSPSVSHTTAPVPFIVVNRQFKKQNTIADEGTLADIAPTILSFMKVEKPSEMTGSSLMERIPDSNGVVLVILDGWGEGKNEPEVNPLEAAKIPNLDFLKENFPYTQLRASEEAVGLPPGRSGNSETGHLTIGAGRVIEQDEVRLIKEMENGLENNKILKAAIRNTGSKACTHVIGVLSEASSHGNIKELLEMCRAARTNGAEKIFVHLILDGRSAPPRSAIDLLKKYWKDLAKYEIVTVVGRGYALDRSKDYIEKTKLVYDSLVYGTGKCFSLTKTGRKHEQENWDS
ncbi:MAG: phosphoglycerate mutase (2,3-diphosphoglycerate-independent) [Kosmotoga sp.]|nr:MAG: phosphoglycerate mutase (2,3-diphosphoglycerate-independent) [Kosmotoga sp.]